MIGFLRKRAPSPVRTEELSRRFRISESTVYRLFRDGLGGSPKEFLTELRLTLARTRLLDSNDTVGTVAAECGFPSATALFELFRARYRQTPTEWRAAK